jgi:hypothetical protein
MTLPFRMRTSRSRLERASILTAKLIHSDLESILFNLAPHLSNPVSNTNNREAIISNMVMDSSKDTVDILSMDSKAITNTTNNSNSSRKAATAKIMADNLLHTTRALVAFSRNSSKDKHP